MLWTAAVVALLLAFANGANDNFKGVATLFGSGTSKYRPALIWATATTFAGSMGAIFIAVELSRRFSGKGIVPDSLVGDPVFLASVGAGAGLTVLLATWRGFPISTTHALVGGLTGAGLVAAGSAVDVAGLGSFVLMPLLLSPVMALALTVSAYSGAAWVGRKLGLTKDSCVCAGTGESVVAVGLGPSGEGVAQVARPIALQVGTAATCESRYHGRMLGVSVQAAMNAVHFVSAGAVSFARGLNDTPKLAALLLAAGAMAPAGSNVIVAVAMAVGGLLGARRVAQTMGRRITEMDDGQGLSANLVTAALVVSASVFGLPVSTTHVSVGSLLGIGATSGRAAFGGSPSGDSVSYLSRHRGDPAAGRTRWNVIRSIVLAWVVTLPLAALLSAAAFEVLRATA